MKSHPFRVGMRLRFRGVDERVGVLLEGPAGWGEFSPFPEYEPRVTSRWYESAWACANEPWPEAVRASVPVNTTVPAVDGPTAYDLVRASGCTTAKVKVAEGGDEERVEAVRDALGPAGRIRVDVNGRWDVDTAARWIKRLDRYNLEYVEQPVATLDEMRALRLKVDVPLAADEVVRTAEDPLAIAGLDAADIVVLKVQPMGGPKRALEVAEACGLPVVVSSALETSVGLAAGVALAAALPALPYACGLGTATLLANDVVDDPLVPVDGTIAVRRVAPDPDRLSEARPDPASERAILARLEAAAALAEVGS